MNIIKTFMYRAFGDWGVMQSCRSISDMHKGWKESGNYGPDDWKDKHQVWTIEPLPLGNWND